MPFNQFFLDDSAVVSREIARMIEFQGKAVAREYALKQVAYFSLCEYEFSKDFYLTAFGY